MLLACYTYYDASYMVLVILFDISCAAIKITPSQLKLELRRRSSYMVCLSLPKMIFFMGYFT